MSITIQGICDFLDSVAPARLAEEWDNVGLLVGDRERPVERVMTCLTTTPGTVGEAIEGRADLIVTHHPLPFQPLKRITTDSLPGRMLLRLAEQRIGVYSPHTAFDSASAGINQRLAEGLELTEIVPLVRWVDDPLQLGAGRRGVLRAPRRLAQVAERVKEFLGVPGLHMVGHPASEMRSIAVACGSAGHLLEAAREAGCDLLVTGEMRFHKCLEAQASDLAVLLPGHFASERFAVELLANMLRQQFAPLEVWASQHETDPLVWV
jgi:dinuclear metal center YbgI/SA1388 family protein